jgi:poly-gamma-glutamate synthesis protein (capsule biosynthesis protein)
LTEHPYPGFTAIADRLTKMDVVFTDLEAAIDGPGAGAPTRDTEFSHSTEPKVLNVLSALSINLAALSNNHSFDLGTGGIQSTIAAVDARRIVHAGTGRTLAEASGPAFLTAHGQTVALVAMASGKIREGGAAGPDHPGVFEIRRDGSGVFNADDEALACAQVKAAAARADIVVAYHHNHWWDEDWTKPPQWLEAFNRRLVDAGAGIVAGHGSPMLHGIEIYHRCPIFYNLGSLIFHTRTKIGYYPPQVWDSALVELTYDGKQLREVRLVPVALNEEGESPATHFETRGRPMIAQGARAKSILTQIQTLSAPYGTQMMIGNEIGKILIPA